MEIGMRWDWKVQSRHQRHKSVEDDSIEAAESVGTDKGEELKEKNLTEEQQAILF